MDTVPPPIGRPGEETEDSESPDSDSSTDTIIFNPSKKTPKTNPRDITMADQSETSDPKEFMVAIEDLRKAVATKDVDMTTLLWEVSSNKATMDDMAHARDWAATMERIRKTNRRIQKEDGKG